MVRPVLPRRVLAAAPRVPQDHEQDARAWARFDLRLLDRATGLSRSVRRAAEPVVFDYSAPPGKCKGKRGARALMLRSELEASPYLRGDRLTI